jgi:phenylalanyl-tRNA synthetase beta chain
MKVPLSWLKDFVEINLPLDELAHRLTLAGLEVEEIHCVGLPLPASGPGRQETKITGFEWEADKIVVGAVHEVMPHPNADRLVLCRLDDGQREHIVLTGAPNLFPYKGQGALPRPIKVAYAKEGARIYDGHQPGQTLVTLKRAKIRGVESYSMACSEKELGISDEHEGIIFLEDDAPTGMPLVEYMGDAVFEIALTPNIARDANILGVAREIAAITGQALRPPAYEAQMDGAPLHGRVSIEITEPPVNPRFVVGLIENVTLAPSPYTVQRRLRLAGMRPINNIVDATNYVMLEIGQPLHAFDYDALRRRAGGAAPAIITRRAHPGEQLTTLDGAQRKLDDFTVMVADQDGALALAGVMGGAETEVGETTRNVLLEGAAWNMVNTRRTVLAQNLPSEAAYRFSRGVHPAMTTRGVLRGLEMMRRWGGGSVAQGLVDVYPRPAAAPSVTITPGDVERWLGVRIAAQEIAAILRALEFEVTASGEERLTVSPPDHRLDIGDGIVGMADVMEEIARIYGYERIPETRMADALPPQTGNPELEMESRMVDLLAGLGLQEVITYRMTSLEREARLAPAGAERPPYLRLANPIAADRGVMRRSLLSSLLEIVERNARLYPRQALFEIGPEFHPRAGQALPDEPLRLALALTGPRALRGWQPADLNVMDFYDIKGVVQALLDGLHIAGVRYEPAEQYPYHPGKCAQVWAGESLLGVFGEMHPLARERYELPAAPLLIGEFSLHSLLAAAPPAHTLRATPSYPPVLEDLALVVDEALPAERVAELIRLAGGAQLSQVRLFDVYRKVGEGKKSLAYSLAYQSPDRTLTDQEAAQIRMRIIRRLENELGAKLRS